MATATRTRKPAAAKDDGFAGITTTNSRGSCPRCRKRDTKGFLKIDVIKYGDQKDAKGSKHIKSRSKSMCATCIKEVFRSLNEAFDKELS